jgi:glycosyltransferase involved in cell wall biosynthesis
MDGDRRVRILQVNKFYDARGGSERVLYDLEDGLRERGHDVGVFSAEHPGNRSSGGSLWLVPGRNYENPGLKDRARNALGTLYDTGVRRAFARALDVFVPDVVHVHNIYHQFSPSILDELRVRRIPAVMTVHDFKLVCPVYRLFRAGEICRECVGRAWPHGVIRHRCSRGSLAESMLLAVESAFHRARRSYERAISVFIAPSRFMAETLAEGGVERASIEISRNAPRLVPTVAAAETRSQRPMLLYAGRLSEEKGVDLLIGAARDCPSVALRIAGVGPEEASLKSAARGLENVVFLGQLDAPALGTERELAWATLAPSRWYENAPLSVIESWWAGRAVLGSDHGGLAEMLADGAGGWSVSPADPRAWSSAFHRVSESPDELARLGKSARERAERDHQFPDLMQRTLNLYDRVTRERD